MASGGGFFEPARAPGLFARMLLLLCLILGFVPAAHADVCDMLRAQVDSIRGSTPALGQLKRQLDALRALERQQQCARRTGIFTLFSACGDIARRKSAVERQIRTASSGTRTAGLKARMASLGCAAQAAKPQREARVANRAPRSAAGWIAGHDMLFCVRLEDGYFFPAPNSGFVTAAGHKLVKSQCRYICDNADMAVYQLHDPALESEEMISVETRQAYKDLPNAFRYRDAAHFKACNLQRYSQRVNEARAQAMTPATVDAKSLVLPVPNARPDIEPIAFSEEEPRASANPLTRKVRVVGPPYLPNE